MGWRVAVSQYFRFRGFFRSDLNVTSTHHISDFSVLYNDCYEILYQNQLFSKTFPNFLIPFEVKEVESPDRCGSSLSKRPNVELLSANHLCHCFYLSLLAILE